MFVQCLKITCNSKFMFVQCLKITCNSKFMFVQCLKINSNFLIILQIETKVFSMDENDNKKTKKNGVNKIR